MKIRRQIRLVCVRERTVRLMASAAPECCELCGAPAQMLTANLAAMITNISQRTLFQWIEGGDIHFVETPSGNMFLCLESVWRRASNEDVFGLESEVVFSHGSCTPNRS